ncbi:MAG: adaptor protein MecA [Clostridia bacterium]|nr:adaptor protein MecA [Clostridia bacterium]
MELILISDSKLKIMLSQTDMIKYALKIEDIDRDDNRARRAFRSILDEAKHKTGFDAASERVFVQVFPCRSGGCEIFVTKLEKDPDTEEISATVSKPRANTIYRFSDLNSLISVCYTLSQQGYEGESAVYCDDKNYYLSISSQHMFIDEYADMRENKKYIYHILEHCEGICTRAAVETLAALR